jgi:hypothetical protein
MMNAFFKKFNMMNISKGIDTFNKVIQDFGDSMDAMTQELSSDVEKSNREFKVREQKDRENLKKIWGDEK